jgi:hypothetical protein
VAAAHAAEHRSCYPPARFFALRSPLCAVFVCHGYVDE